MGEIKMEINRHRTQFVLSMIAGLGFVYPLPDHDDCRGNCLTAHATPLDPITSNSPIAHSRHSYKTADRPSLPVEEVFTMVNEKSTLHSLAITPPARQAMWVHPTVGAMPVTPLAPPPPP